MSYLCYKNNKWIVDPVMDWAKMKSETSVVRISRALDVKLDALAARTGRKKSYYASKAIERYLEDLEDYNDAKEALKNSKRRYSLEEAARKLGLDY